MHQQGTELAITLNLRRVSFGQERIVRNAILFADHSLRGAVVDLVRL
jgi:hypothetical protein